MRKILDDLKCLKRKAKAAHDKDDGFTLVELMVVIVIIGLLATVVVINVLPSQDRAMVEKARADIQTLSNAMMLYRVHNLTFPSTDQGLQALRRAPDGLANPQRYQPGGYVQALPQDPWGNPYQYVFPGDRGQNFDLYSLGADGRLGGEGLNADVGNWANDSDSQP